MVFNHCYLTVFSVSCTSGSGGQCVVRGGGPRWVAPGSHRPTSQSLTAQRHTHYITTIRCEPAADLTPPGTFCLMYSHESQTAGTLPEWHLTEQSSGKHYAVTPPLPHSAIHPHPRADGTGRNVRTSRWLTFPCTVRVKQRLDGEYTPVCLSFMDAQV